MNLVISKRFVKKQQMRWTQRGAHRLLQTRMQVLNEDLRDTFCRWFPGMNVDQPAELKDLKVAGPPVCSTLQISQCHFMSESRPGGTAH